QAARQTRFVEQRTSRERPSRSNRRLTPAQGPYCPRQLHTYSAAMSHDALFGGLASIKGTIMLASTTNNNAGESNTVSPLGKVPTAAIVLVFGRCMAAFFLGLFGSQKGSGNAEGKA